MDIDVCWASLQIAICLFSQNDGSSTGVNMKRDHHMFGTVDVGDVGGLETNAAITITCLTDSMSCNDRRESPRSSPCTRGISAILPFCQNEDRSTGVNMKRDHHMFGTVDVGGSETNAAITITCLAEL